MKFSPLLLIFLTGALSAAPSFEFRDGENVVLLGDGFIER